MNGKTTINKYFCFLFSFVFYTKPKSVKKLLSVKVCLLIVYLFVYLGGSENDDQNRLRFQIELEFVQCLANPNYLNCKYKLHKTKYKKTKQTKNRYLNLKNLLSVLAQRGYFKDPVFVNYLKYLLYWKEPEYAKFLKYPMCLYFLDLLQYEHFRREVVNSQCTKFIDDQQILLWQHYTRRRTRLLQAAAEQTPHSNSQNNGIAQSKVL